MLRLVRATAAEFRRAVIPWWVPLAAVLIAGLTFLAVGLLFGQDTAGQVLDTIVPPTDTTGTAPPLVPWTWGVEEISKLVIPALGAWLLKQWNVAKGKLDGIPNLLKSAAYVAITTVGMYLGDLIGYVLDKDPLTWGVDTWQGVAAGIVGTILVKLGISSAKEKAVAPVIRGA